MRHFNIDFPPIFSKYIEYVKQSCLIWTLALLISSIPMVDQYAGVVATVAIFCFVLVPAGFALVDEILDYVFDRFF